MVRTYNIDRTNPRFSNGGRIKIYANEEILIPEYSYGECTVWRSLLRKCMNIGELGDGMCESCWDRKQHHFRKKDKQSRQNNPQKYNGQVLS